MPGLGEVKGYGRPRDGFSFGPSFRYVRARNSGDYSELTGLQNVDAAYEIGGRVAYRFGALGLTPRFGAASAATMAGSVRRVWT